MKTPDISVLIPSRGNPSGLFNTVAMLLSRASAPQLVEVIVRLDFDDTAIPEYVRNCFPQKTIIGPPHGYASNEYYEDCLRLSRGRLIWVFNDDVEVQTHGWDARYQEALALIPFGVAGAHIKGDHYQWCMPMVQREVFDRAGCFCPSEETCDRIFESYGRQSGRGVIADVVLNHPQRPLEDGSQRAEKYKYAQSHWAEMCAKWDGAAALMVEKCK